MLAQRWVEGQGRGCLTCLLSHDSMLPPVTLFDRMCPESLLYASQSDRLLIFFYQKVYLKIAHEENG